MSALAYAFCFIAALAAAVYLVVTGHPWFAGLVLLLIACLEYHSKSDDSPRRSGGGE